jgi:catechol 2,3-dioxygenase-like lactoylglutathione lyase family enzyme
MILRIHHVQLAMPADGEGTAVAFYGELLGMHPVTKPAQLAALGGVWFECVGSAMQLHVGVEEPFRPAKKAHPALLVEDLGAVETALRSAGHPISVETQLDGYRRFYTEDPFGNRLEILAEDTRPANAGPADRA